MSDKKAEWDNDLIKILKSPRIAEMTFHFPKVDKDKEIITAEAMADALEHYRHLPIIQEFHKERPVGVCERAWQTHGDEFKGIVRFSEDPSNDDVWRKVETGQYDQVSIAGRRTEFSEECNIHQSLRSEHQPCKTTRLRLDSISVCDEAARNDHTSLSVVKADLDDPSIFSYTTFLSLKQIPINLIKAETTESELIHPVTDGANQPDKTRVDDNIFNPLIHPATGKNTVKGGKMKKGTEKPVKKTSDEEAQEPVEETEAKKGEEEETTEPEKEVEKGMEQSEAHMTDQSTMLREILATLKQLVATDKQVHSEVGKAEETPAEEKKEEKKEEKEEKCVKKAAEVPEEDLNVKKAAMEQEFQKALNAAVAPLNDKITALEAEVKRLGDEPLYKSGFKLTEMFVDKEGNPEMGNAGALDAQRKKTSRSK